MPSVVWIELSFTGNFPFQFRPVVYLSYFCVKRSLGDFIVLELWQLLDSLAVGSQDWIFVVDLSLCDKIEQLESLIKEEVDVAYFGTADIGLFFQSWRDSGNLLVGYIRKPFHILICALQLVARHIDLHSDLLDDVSHHVDVCALLWCFTKELWHPFISNVLVDSQSFTHLESVVLKVWKIREIHAKCEFIVEPFLSVTHVACGFVCLIFELDSKEIKLHSNSFT